MSIEPDLYQKVTTNVGLLDGSRLYGRVVARGKDAVDLLHRMSTNDMTPLEQASPGSVLTVLTNEKGRFVDVLKVVRDASNRVLMITSAGAEGTVSAWLDKYTIMEDAAFTPASERVAQLSLVGPHSCEILQRYATSDLAAATRSDVHTLTLAGNPATLVKGPSLAGDGWFILIDAEHEPAAFAALAEDVHSIGGGLVTDALFETLRVENGTPLMPSEINEKHTPLELGLADEAVSFTKGCYIGQEVIARLDAQGKVQRKLIGILLPQTGAQVGDRLVDESLAGAPLGDEVGEITSIAVSPRFGMIALAYVRAKQAVPGSTLKLRSADAGTGDAGALATVTLVGLPFASLN